MSRSIPSSSFVAVAVLAACSSPEARNARSPDGAARAAVAAAPAPIDHTDAAPARVVRRPGEASRRGSGVLLAELDGREVAYVADEDDSAIRVIDVEDERELSVFHPGGAPTSLVMLPDGRLVAALRDKAELVVVRGGGTPTSRLVVDLHVGVASEPVGLALSPDDDTLVATSGWGRRVTVLDAHTFAQRAEHVVGREPRSVVISSDGKRAFVSHAVGQSLDMIRLDTPPSVTTSATSAKRLTLGGSEELVGHMLAITTQVRSACQGFALAKSDSGRIFAPHVLVFSGEAEVSSGYGGGGGREAEVFNIPVVDEDSGRVIDESKRLRAGFNQEPSNRNCALPRAAVVGKAGLFVTCLGDDHVQLFDADAVNPHDVQLKTWAVPAGPTAIAIDEAKGEALVWSQFAHALTKIAIDDGGDDARRPFAISSIHLQRPEDPKVARGRILFHATTDRRISSDGRACASCHPDGRDDTLVWSSPKGPRQTPMLVGRLEGAAPFGWNGDAPSVSLHLVQTVKRLGGTGIEGEDKEALMAYLTAMRPPPTQAVAATAHDSALRGAEIFRSDAAGCAGCHGPSGDLPDGSQHDVKSRSAADVASKFDTPSLRFVGASAPYFHDGRYPDLKTLLVKSDGKMGHTKHLSPTELADLETYLERL